jgi:Xaa-Pro dipeptidase
MIDNAALELGRLARLRFAIQNAGCDAGLFYDPTNIRYATGTSNMQVYSLHNACRYVYVPVEGDVVLFDFKGCEHLSTGHPAVDEVRDATSWYHFVAGPRVAELARRWSDEISSLLGPARTGGRRLAVDRLDPIGLRELERHGITVTDGQEVASMARVIKTDLEIEVMRLAIRGCEAGIHAMAAEMRPGITEQALWSHLHRVSIEQGGEWFETRLLTSGPRTNPWYQECSDRVIEDGDLVAFDTDFVGFGGYSVDISRTWFVGDGRPTDEQRRMYAAAHEMVTANIDLLQPGTTFRELADAAHVPVAPLHTRNNGCVAHGVGLCNEFPLLQTRDNFDNGYDGMIETGMVLCVESLIAPVGAREAVKLEEQVLVTATGPELLSSYPFEQRLLD